MTWNSTRDAATTRVESYRVSNGNLGCPWPVDVRPELEKEREALRSRLGTAEGRTSTGHGQPRFPFDTR